MVEQLLAVVDCGNQAASKVTKTRCKNVRGGQTASCPEINVAQVNMSR